MRSTIGLISIAIAACSFASVANGAAPVPVAAPAGPAANPMEATFGNTVKISGEDGDVFVYFNRDGTFTSRGPKGDEFGTWKIVGDKVCTHTKSGGESCGVVQLGRKVGDKWQQQVDGKMVDVTILPGR